MNKKIFLLSTGLFLSVASVFAMEQEQASIVQKCMHSAKNLTQYVPSLQEVKNAFVKAKNTIIVTVKENPRIAIAVGTGTAALASVYIYYKMLRSNNSSPVKCTTGEEPSANDKVIGSVTQSDAEYIETFNDSDEPLALKVIVPAKARARTQIIKQ